MHRTARFSPLLCVALASLLAACGGPAATTDAGPEQSTDSGHSNTDAGNANTDAGPVDAGPGDAGPDGNCAPMGEAKHQSYVPCAEKPKNPVRLIVMGDSISAGYGATNPSTMAECSDQCPESYVGLLQTNDNSLWPTETNTSLSALYSTPNFPIVSVAHPGDTTANTAGDQLTNLTAALGGSGTTLPVVQGESIVVITIGGNDVVGVLENALGSPTQAEIDTAINTIISNLRKTMAYLQNTAEFPDGTDIYLANLYDPSDSTGMLPSQCFGLAVNSPQLDMAPTELAERYQQLGAELGFAVIDDLGAFHGHGLIAASMTDPNYDASDPVDWFYTDCIHPTNDGHNSLRRLFFEAIDVGNYTATDL